MAFGASRKLQTPLLLPTVPEQRQLARSHTPVVSKHATA